MSLSIYQYSRRLPLPLYVAEDSIVLSLGELFMIYDLRDQGLSIKAIAQQGDALSKCLFLWSKQVSALHRAY